MSELLQNRHVRYNNRNWRAKRECSNLLDFYRSVSYSFFPGGEKYLPKSVVFKANSIVYFQGDVDERVYILKNGRIALKGVDIETGEEIQELIQTGEFFGVKSALGHFPREEDAVALSDAQCVVFSVAEFEQLAASNTRIILKMLRVFSQQLRRIHAKVSSMLNTRQEVNPEQGLFHSAEFYYQRKKFDYALYILKRYQELYPDGAYKDKVKEYLGRGEQLQKVQSNRQQSQPEEQSPTPQGRGGLTSTGKVYFEAESHFANGKYDEAEALFRKVAEDHSDEEYRLKARFEIGRTLFAKEDYAGTIKYYSRLVQEIPKLPRIADVLFIIGQSYVATGDKGKGKTFMQRAKSMANDNPALVRKIDRELTRLE